MIIDAFAEHHHCNDPRPSGVINVFGGMECLSCGYEVVVAEHLSPALVADYRAFLQSKRSAPERDGLSAGELHPALYDFQRAVVTWALRRGRAAIWADCGLGKSQMQLEWARVVAGEDGVVLIFAPLCVGAQTFAIAEEFGIDAAVRIVRQPDDLAIGINLANYEIAHKFVEVVPLLAGLVLDESSILKSLDGKTKKLLLESFTAVKYRLCCTATPCPNDIAELANHAEFLGVMTRAEMLATFFVHDDAGWRLRKHAKEPFYRWLATWGMAFKSPANIGFDGSRFVLPTLEIKDSVVETAWRREGELFPGYRLKGIQDRISVRRASTGDRVRTAAHIALRTTGQIIIWCGLDAEAKAVAKVIPQSVKIHGSDKPADKERKLRNFLRGADRVLVTKLRIAGFGLNLQCASTMIFLGMSDSYEQYYQGIRRCWRFGQTQPVTAWIVVSDHETSIVENVRRKERDSDSLTRGIIEAMKDYEREELSNAPHKEEFEQIQTAEGPGWQLSRGDCVEVMATMPAESVDLSVYSPPFASLYVYSASERDLGNSASPDQFFKHLGFAIDGLLRITKAGRIGVCHIAQQPLTLLNDGLIGLRDLRGRAVEEFVSRGWIYQGEVCIDKDPQAQAIRTHAKGLLFVQKERDSSWLRPGLADYLLIFRKPGDNAVPIKADITNNEWIEWARPIWYGIRETDTLNIVEARDPDDERHICPLQLGVIERAIRLWSNPGETVFSPFAGIGSEGYKALQLERRFIGAELKPRYFDAACRNLKKALSERTQQSLFVTEP